MPKIKPTDYHIHTSYSADSEEKMENVIESAIEKGVSEIAFTDHREFFSYYKRFVINTDYNKYLEHVNLLREKYASKLKIVFGVEIGLNTNYEKEINELVKQIPFDFVIGSTHDLNAFDTFSKENNVMDNYPKQVTYGKYFEETLNNIKTFDCFSVYGHLDYIERYGKYSDNKVHYAEFKDVLDEILRSIIKKDKGIEVNTSGLRYGLDTTHPSLEIIKRYKELGGEIITIGSDAHEAKYVAYAFDYATQLLKEAGFDSYCLFRNSKPYFVKL